MNLYQVISRPLITEKSSFISTEEVNKVTFRVHVHANKDQIKKAVEKFFKVSVTEVWTMHYKGKPKRIGRNSGTSPRWKKAIISLKKGDKITLIEGI